MKVVFPGFILGHMLRDNRDNYVSVEDLNEAAQRIRQRVPDVIPVIDIKHIYALLEYYPAMFEKVETPGTGRFEQSQLGFRRAEDSEKYFGRYLENVFHAENSGVCGLEGSFNQEDIARVLGAIASN
jgi:hypothetical protein